MDEIIGDALEHIFLQIDDAKTLAKCSLVCRRWASILAPSSSFWIVKCKRDKKTIPVPFLGAHAALDEGRIDYRIIWHKNPYGRNLIKNDSGQERFKHWQIEPSGPNHWIMWDHPQTVADGSGTIMHPIENPRRMVDNAHGSVLIDHCFATSHFECRKTQTIDLWAEGVQRWVLNELTPPIVVSEWHTASRVCGSTYSLSVSLFQDKWVGPADTFQESCTVQQWQGGIWQQSLHKFRGYPDDVRYVVFTSSGQDTQAWAGFFGAKMAKASVSIEFE